MGGRGGICDRWLLNVGSTERVLCYREIEVNRKSGGLRILHCRRGNLLSTESMERLLTWGMAVRGKLLIVRYKAQERVLCI